MNVQIRRAAHDRPDRDGEDLRLQPRAVADRAGRAIHEGANAAAGKFAFRFLVEPLHLREQSFERPRRLGRGPAVAAEAHLDRLIARPEVKRLLEFLRQILKRDVFGDIEMPNERRLQPAIVGLHPFCAAPPWHDRAFRERLRGIGHHQFRIADQLRAESMTGRTGAEMAVKGKMFRRELRLTRSRFRDFRSRSSSGLPPTLLRLDVERWTLDVGRLPLASRSTTIRFPPHFNAVSTESASRVRIPSRITSRSTTASIVCRSPFLQPDRFRPAKLDDLAIHPNPDKTFAFRFLDHVAKFAALVPHQRREQNDFRLRRIGRESDRRSAARFAEKSAAR